MLAATGWLQAVLARPDGPPRLQVLDEAWSLLASERTSRYLQAWWKLGRAYGVANVAIVHRLSDLRAQADDGPASAKVSMGLLAEFGRASCRERVGQYVEFSVGAVSLKKKKN